MEFTDVINKRRSTRKYRDKEISKEIIKKIINAARLAPSGMNSQPWRFVVIQNKGSLKKIAEMYAYGRKKLKIYAQDTSFVENVALILVCSTTEFPWAKSDCYLAIENLVLAATNEGLGSLFLGAFMVPENIQKLKEMCNIPDNLEIVMPIAIGYADEEPKMPVKKELKDILFYEKI